MRKRLAVLLLAAFLCAGLGGCLEHPLHHNRWEVLAYLKETYPGEKITVSWKYYEEPDSEYNLSTDRVWDCYFDDTPEVVFRVRSSWWNGGPIPVVGYALRDDVNQTFWRHYLDQYLAGVGNLDAWNIENYELETEFSTMEQVYPAAEQLTEFFDWYVEQPHSGSGRSATYYLTGVPLPTWLLKRWGYIRHDTEETGAYDALVNSCAEMLKGYYAFYNLPCPEFTPEEMQAYALETWLWDEGYEYPDSIWFGAQYLPRSTFAGIGVYAHYISYAGFYEMLSRLDYETEGTPEHFSLTGRDGCLYEFSYDFWEEADGEPQWYFTCDGERLTSGSISYINGAPLLYLKDERLQDMVGLQLIYR